MDFPKSFHELRQAVQRSDYDTPSVWSKLSPFFLAHGLTLWVKGKDMAEVVPPDNRPRAPDGFQYRSPHDVDYVGRFLAVTGSLLPARTKDGRDVVIRLVSIGNEGANHRQALERLATGNIASVIGNHTIPVLQWLNLDDLCFAVFPFLMYYDILGIFLYENTEDLVNEVFQICEAVEFCHAHLVAHRDIFRENFLANFAFGAGFDTCGPGANRIIKPFRSLFPFKVYIIDFELAVCFEPGSDPATHVVSGKPVDGTNGYTYARPVAPEMESDAPYNAFAADIWQLGTYLFELAEEHKLPDALTALFERMTHDVPAERPTATDVVRAVRTIKSELTLQELRSPVYIGRPPPPPRKSSPAPEVVALDSRQN